MNPNDDPNQTPQAVDIGEAADGVSPIAGSATDGDASGAYPSPGPAGRVRLRTDPMLPVLRPEANGRPLEETRASVFEANSGGRQCGGGVANAPHSGQTYGVARRS